MADDVTRKILYLLFRDGRYYARRSVPPELRQFVGTIELREPLGPDRRLAIDKLPVALVKINAKLDHARRALEAQLGAEAAQAAARSAPMTPSELARTHYNDQLALDDALRDSGSNWAVIDIDDTYVADLRAAAAGSLRDDQLTGLLGSFLKRYSLRGNVSASPGTPEWRQVARAIADAELQVVSRMYERDDGTASHELSHPAHLAPIVEELIDKPFVEPLSLRQLLEKHLRGLEANGGGISARKAWTPVFEGLLQFLKVSRTLKGPAILTS